MRGRHRPTKSTYTVAELRESLAGDVLVSVVKSPKLDAQMRQHRGDDGDGTATSALPMELQSVMSAQSVRPRSLRAGRRRQRPTGGHRMIRRFFTDGVVWLSAFWLILFHAVLGLYGAEPAPIVVEAVQP